MATIEIRAERVIQADPMRIWEVLEDHENLYKWLNFDKSVRRRPGTGEPNGVGAVRTLHRGRRVMEERITRFEPGRRLEYAVVRGAPGRAARGDIILNVLAPGSTLVWWRVKLEPYVRATGPLIRLYLGRALKRGLEQLQNRLEPETIATRAPTLVLVKGDDAKEPGGKNESGTDSRVWWAGRPSLRASTDAQHRP